jgi:hypothetical protein
LSTRVRINGGTIDNTPVGASAPNVGGFTAITATSSILSSSATAGIGYKTGAGGSVAQSISKTSDVTLNTLTGRLLMSGAALPSTGTACFRVRNSSVAASDVINAVIADGATDGAYTLQIDAVAAGSFRICLNNRSSLSLSESVVINYAVLRGAY